MKRRLLFKNLGKAANIISAVLLIASVVTNFVPLQGVGAVGNPGAIWTTTNACGDESQDVNHFIHGNHVYINGDGFAPETEYDWAITGQPGGASGDPNVDVASGTFTTDDTGAFCFDAYTVLDDDWGEYSVKFGTKGDNYRVEKQQASASVVAGLCEWTEANGSLTSVAITLTGASLTIDGLTYDSSTTIFLPPGSYPYTWTALDGYTGSGGGTLIIGDCTPGSGTASIQTGVCSWNENDGSLTPVDITLSNASLTINGTNYTSSTSINLEPGSYPYTWVADDGYLGSGEGTLIVGDCTPGTGQVSIEIGTCTYDEENGSQTPVTINMVNASVTVEGVGTFYPDSTNVNLDPGNYNYYWAGLDGYLGSGEGTLNIGSCEPPNPSLSITKSADTNVFLAAGDTVNYSYDVTNTGNITLSNITVTDDKTVVSCPAGDLEPGDTITCTASYVITTSDMSTCLVVNTAYAEGEYSTRVVSVETQSVRSDNAQASVRCFIPLSLVGFCAADPSLNNGWNITNPNIYPVDYEITNADGTFSFAGAVPVAANSTLYFETPKSAGYPIKLWVGGELQDTAPASLNCAPGNFVPNIPVTAVEPPATGGEVLIPVTGIDLSTFGHSLPGNLFSLSLGFFGLGLVLTGISRKQEEE